MTRNEHIITEEEAAFPSTPFLLIDAPSVGVKYFIVESWEVIAIEVLHPRHFAQTIEWTGHKASEGEIEKFLKEEDE